MAEREDGHPLGGLLAGLIVLAFGLLFLAATT